MIRKLLTALGFRPARQYILEVTCGGFDHAFMYPTAAERQEEYNDLMKAIRSKKGGFHTILNSQCTIGVALKVSEITSYAVKN